MARTTAAKKKSKPPKWLPDGWTTEVGVTDRGAKIKYYLSPLSGRKFRSKKEVLHYLTVTKDEGHASEITSCSGDNRQIQAKSFQEWLPPGWILEIGVWTNGEKAGEKYKCYYDPFTRSRFYSKADVLCFLESGKLSTPTCKQQEHSRGNPDNVLLQIEYSPDGLPHGWVKEVVFRKSSSSGRGTRKDPYYTDPVYGYIFRSLRDATLYVSTGEVSKSAYRSRKKSIREMCSLEDESSPAISDKELKSLGTTARRSLFTEDAVKSNGVKTTEVDVPADHVTSESAVKACPIISSPNIEGTRRGTKYKRSEVTEPAAENILEVPKHPKSNCSTRTLPRRASKRLAGCEPEQATENMLETLEQVAMNKPKLPPQPCQASKELAGCELEQADENMLDASKQVDKNKPKVLDLPCRASKRLAGCEPGQATENILETSEQVAKNKPNLLGLPCRASKRLAGCEPEQPTAKVLETSKHVVKNKPKLVSLPRRASKRLAGCEPEQEAENMVETSEHMVKNNPKLLPLLCRASKQPAVSEPDQATENVSEISMEMEKNKPKELDLPCRASKRLAGSEPEPAAANESETSKRVELENKYKLLLPSESLEGLNGCEPKPANEITPEITKHAEKSKSKLLAPPRRASKRLAGCEPAPVAELVISSQRAKSIPNSEQNGEVEAATQKVEEEMPLVEPKDVSWSNDGIKDEVLLAERKSTRSVGVQTSPEVEQVVADNPTDDRPPGVPAFPFLDCWADPCIEFAVKTLMGDIPVFNDIAIPENVSVPTSNPSSSANHGGPQDHQHLHVDVEANRSPLDHRLPSGSKSTERKIEHDHPMENGLPSGLKAAKSKVEGDREVQ